jgi:predicted Zn-dependent protease
MPSNRLCFIILAGIVSTAQCIPAMGPPQVSQKEVPTAQEASPYDAKEARPALRYDVSRVGHRRIDHGMNLYSQKDERLLGSRLAALFEQNAQVIANPAIANYLKRLEETISRSSDVPYPITIKVIRDVEVNAYSLPGGFIYVQSGLILAVENEAQLIAALSHEAAHIAGRHFTRLVTQQKVWKWSLLIAGGPAGYLVNREAVPLFLARSLRSAELEADLIGLQYEYASGYDPTEFVNLIWNVSREEGKSTLSDHLRDSHPPSNLRMRRAKTCIRNYLPARSEELVDTSEFQEFKAQIAALIMQNP